MNAASTSMIRAQITNINQIRTSFQQVGTKSTGRVGLTSRAYEGKSIQASPIQRLPPRQIQPRVSLYVGYDTTLEQICTPSSFQRVRNSPALECFEGSGERSHPLHWIPTACNVTTVVHYSASNHFKFLFPDSEPTLNVLLLKHLNSSFQPFGAQR